MENSPSKRKKLEDLLLASNHTQRSLADAVGVSERTISDWLRGVRLPRLDRAYRLALALRVPLDEIVDAFDIKKN